MVKIKKIIKRDSRAESFKPEKIQLSIKASFDSAGLGTTDEEVDFLTKRLKDGSHELIYPEAASRMKQREQAKSRQILSRYASLGAFNNLI